MVRGLAGQPLREPPRLFQPDGVQAHVHVTLEAQFAIPVSLAVSQQDQFGHWCNYLHVPSMTK